jgi:outer membrane murein-binding lipoprotein Lpp
VSADHEEILRLRERVHTLEATAAGVSLLAGSIEELRIGQRELATSTHAAIEAKAQELHEENETMDKRVRSLESGLSAVNANVRLSIGLLSGTFVAVVGFGISVLLQH